MDTIKRLYLRIKYRKHYEKVMEWNKKRIDEVVYGVITDRNPYKVWGYVIPAEYLTEWEIRYVERCSTFDSEDLKRWLMDKLNSIREKEL